MKALNEIEWKSFLLSDLFDFEKGNQNNMAELMAGDTPLVSAKKENNGYKDFVAQNNKKIWDAHRLTLNNDGDGGAGIAFYQPFEFMLDTHVTALRQKQSMSKYALLFISNCITKQRSKFGHGYSLTAGRIKKFRFMLPVDSCGNPNYVYMEEYMKEKERVILLQYKQYLSDLIDNQQITMGGVNLNNKIEWRCFMLGELFEFEVGRSKGLNHLSHCDKGINYLGATNVNNGVLCQVENKEEYVQKGNCIAFIRNGEGSMGYSVYKAEDFIATSDISVGYNPHLNKYIGMFITTIADKVRGKYNFGYKRSATRLAKESVMLPVMSDGQPDYAFMEAYMRNKESKCLKQYVDYLENLLN